jgi:hypothetical protein
VKPFAVLAPLTAAISAFAFASALAAPPHRVTLRYDVSQNGVTMVEATETLEHDGRSYRIQSDWQGKGLFALSARGKAQRSSQGAIDARGLVPREFRDQRGDGPLGVARFDWAKRLLTRVRDGRTETEPLPDRTQDRLTLAYGFAFAPPSVGGGEFSVNIADSRGLSRNRYVIVGREVLKTAAGEFEALKLVKQREPDDERGTEIWLALKRDYLPLRVLVIEKDGTRLDQIVTRIES